MTLSGYWKSCLDLILPPVCLLCGQDDERGELCPRCDQLLRTSWPPRAVACRRCGLPAPPAASDLQAEVAPGQASGEPSRASGEPGQATGAAAPPPAAAPPAVLAPAAGRPRQEATPCAGCPAAGFAFDAVTPLAVYQGAVREAVVATKRAGNAALAAALGTRLGDHLLQHQAALQRRGEPWPELITFVPTGLFRRLQRGGTSGAACIAAAVSGRLGLPAVALLRQTRTTAKQSLLPDEKRRENVQGAFALARGLPGWPRPLIRDRHLLLIDDVLTSGSTATEISRVLKQAGAASVHLAVVARAVRR